MDGNITSENKLVGRLAKNSAIYGVVAQTSRAEWEKFWDAFQANGTRRSYEKAFGNPENEQWWTADSFKPKYDIVMGNGDYAFQNSDYDFMAYLEANGLKIDTAQATSLREVMHGCSEVRELGEIDLSAVLNNNTALFRSFRNCPKLHTVRKLIVPDRELQFRELFNYDYALKNITVEGVICTSIGFIHSPLTLESARSIITALKDHSGTEKANTYTLSLSEATKTAIQNDLTAPGGISWYDYGIQKGWKI